MLGRQLFRDLPIRSRIVSVLALVIALEATICLVGIYFLHRMNANLSEILEVQAEKIKQGARINRNLVEIHREEKEMILSAG